MLILWIFKFSYWYYSLGFHHFDITTIVDAENLEKRDELEIAKVCIKFSIYFLAFTYCEWFISHA